jgi:hypothetical protein
MRHVPACGGDFVGKAQIELITRLLKLDDSLDVLASRS